MIVSLAFAGKRYAVLGLARSGLATVRALHASGAHVTVWDRRPGPRDEVAAWEREGIVEYLGETADVRPYIADADCVVLPSYREGVPRTLMEASAMGRPIVATRVPGCREVVADGENGLLCEARNAGALAATLARMLDLDDAARAAMAARGRKKIEKEFDERVVVQRYRELIREITGSTF